MKGIFHHGTPGFFRSTLRSVVVLGLTSALFTMGLGAFSALPASATQLSTDQAAAQADQIAFLQAGGLASNAFFTTDATAAIGTDDVVLQAANGSLVAATAAVTVQMAFQLQNDRFNALQAQANYLGSGGLASASIFTADVTAALGTNDLALQAANDALFGAAIVLNVATNQLFADRNTAQNDLANYQNAGGLPSASVFTTDVAAALGTNDTALVAANTALEAATTALFAASAKLTLDRATALTDQTAYNAAPGHNDLSSVFQTDVAAANGSNDAALVAANTALKAATATLDAAAAKLLADKATAAIDQVAYAAASGAACNNVGPPVCATDVNAAAGSNDAYIVAANTNLFAATAAFGAPGVAAQTAAQFAADQATALADQGAYPYVDALYNADVAAAALPASQTNDIILKAANATLEAAGAALAQYVLDQATAVALQGAYPYVDAVYNADVAASVLTEVQVSATGNPVVVDAALQTANANLLAATVAVTDLGNKFAANVATAGTDQLNYTAAGGLQSDLVYMTDVNASAAPVSVINEAALVAANAALAAATTALNAAAIAGAAAAQIAAGQLAADQASASTDQIAYLVAGGLASNAVFTADAIAAIGTSDVALVAANAALVAATTVLNAPAVQLAADKVTAGTAQTAYTAAGGLATDAVFTADVTAAAGTSDTALVAANTALAAGTAALVAKLAADKVTAGTDQTAYTAAGGLATNVLYTTDVTAAAGTNDAALVAANTALAAATAALVAPASPPTAVTATGGQNSITVSWTAPASTGGSPITGYVVTGTTGNTTVSCGAVVASASTCILVGLADATAYAVSVEAVNAHGASTAAAASATTLPAVTKPPVVVPFRVTGVHGTAVAGRTVTVTITGNGFYGQPRITSSVAGTRAVVSHDNGTLLTVRVTTRAGTARGVGTFTVRLANGKAANVKYNHA